MVTHASQWLQDRISQHERFWSGDGPSLILIPAPAETSPTESVSPALATFAMEPEIIFDREAARARAVVGWPTDGIPTVRPNYGVVFIPSIAGQAYRLPEGQMPWPGQPLSQNEIRAIPGIPIDSADLMRRAESFYRILEQANEPDIAGYHPDTQGVFDIAHMLYGERIFCDVIDPSSRPWIDELLEICLDLYLRVSRHIKALLKQPDGAMIHGHGTAQGVYFPHAGVRTSDDTAILFAPSSIEEIIVPVIEKSAAPFGGAFAHFCGRCEYLFDQLCRSPLIRAIDVQPGMHDPAWLLERCAETGTVLYSRIESLPGETWQPYIRRIGGLVQSTGARCILRPTVFPSDRAECQQMLDIWRQLTCR